MKIINLKISGIPYGQRKVFGNKEAPKQWAEEIIKQTQKLPKIKEACLMKVTFLLPLDKFPNDYPFGSDLDNLLKRFCDALSETIFSEAKGKDSCIISLNATKSKVENTMEAGALLEILPINIV
ncbi:MAG: hypothetical protein ABH865_09025 [Candidatus Omnitrophota bacterium]